MTCFTNPQMQILSTILSEQKISLGIQEEKGRQNRMEKTDK